MIHALSTDVHRSPFWRFSNGTFFNYQNRTYKKTSAVSATYLDKLHGLTIAYFNPFQQFTYIKPERFEGTVVPEDAMAVIQLDEPWSQVKYDAARSDYLDKLRQEVDMENHILARPNFSGPPLLRGSIRVSRFALVVDALMLPCRTVFNAYRAGVPAAVSFLRSYPRWFADSWKVARWDFWNASVPRLKPFIHVPVRPMVTTIKRYRWDKDSNQYKETFE